MSCYADLQFRGLARIGLDRIQLDHVAVPAHRAVSGKNVARLVRIFELEGCQRTSREAHCIDAVIDSEHLPRDALPQRLPLQGDELPRLEVNVQCLNGFHRILAAQDFLDDNDRWWSVRLFTADPSNQHANLAEQYSNEQNFTDGEIFRKIRLYHREGNIDAESRWWARLTETKRKDLRQLLKNGDFATAFDDLLKWPGLWYPIRLGSFHRLLTMKCDEELLSYLRHTVTTWRTIVEDFGSDFDHSSLDESTIKALEGLAPAFSECDAGRVRDLFERRAIFKSASDHARQILQRKLLVLPHMIPSLFTFFESLKYLEPCAKVMRTLVPTKPKRSIRTSFWACYYHTEQQIVYYGEGDARNHSFPSIEAARSAAYQQLWLYVLRHYPEMTNTTTRKEIDQEKPVVREPNPIVCQGFATLALELGFRNKIIERLRDADAWKQLATQVVNQCGYPSDMQDSIVAGVLQALKHRHVKPSSVASGRLVGDAEIPAAKRHGRPFADDHVLDRGSLFLPCLYPVRQERGLHATTFFFKRDMFMNCMSATGLPASTTFVAQPAPTAADGEREQSCADFQTQACLQCANLAQRNEALQSQVDCLKQQVQQAEACSLEYRADKDTSATAMQAALDNATNCRHELERIQHHNSVLEHEMATLKSDAERTRAELEELNQRCEDLDDERYQLQVHAQNQVVYKEVEERSRIDAWTLQLSEICDRFVKSDNDIRAQLIDLELQNTALMEAQKLENHVLLRILLADQDQARAMNNTWPSYMAETALNALDFVPSCIRRKCIVYVGDRRLVESNLKSLSNAVLAKQWVQAKYLSVYMKSQDSECRPFAQLQGKIPTRKQPARIASRSDPKPSGAHPRKKLESNKITKPGARQSKAIEGPRLSRIIEAESRDTPNDNPAARLVGEDARLEGTQNHASRFSKEIEYGAQRSTDNRTTAAIEMPPRRAIEYAPPDGIVNPAASQLVRTDVDVEMRDNESVDENL